MREIHQLGLVLLHFLADFVVRSGLFVIERRDNRNDGCIDGKHKHGHVFPHAM